MDAITIAETDRNEAHVMLEVRGFGTPGSRPLLGVVCCTPAEADYLVEALAAELRARLDVPVDTGGA